MSWPRKVFKDVSDKNLNVLKGCLDRKACFDPRIHFSCRDNPGLSMAEIQGGLIFIKKYSLQATVENELVSCNTLLSLGVKTA